MRASFTSLSILVAAGLLGACSSSPPDAPPATSSSTATSSSSGSTSATTTGAGGGDPGATSSSTTGAGGVGAGGAPAVPYPAPHPSMPQIPNLGGVVLHDPTILTVTFPGDELEAKERQLGQEIGGYSWWTTVHGGYGVGPATSAGNVAIPDALPAAMSDDEVEQWLLARIDDGSLPPPTDQMIYALYVPASTVVSFSADAGGGSSCTDFLGYHSSVNALVAGQAVPAAYAVINRCGDLDSVTETASHELTEASTDPHPIAGTPAFVMASDNAWTVLGGEDADMCAGVQGVVEGGFALTRVWNNVPAAKGDQPCLPLLDGADAVPYFNAALVDDLVKARPGDTVSTQIDCYSFGPLPGELTLEAQPVSKQTLGFTFDKPTCTNGDVVTMTIAVAKSATHATDYHYTLVARLDEGTAHGWRGMVHVK